MLGRVHLLLLLMRVIIRVWIAILLWVLLRSSILLVLLGRNAHVRHPLLKLLLAILLPRSARIARLHDVDVY